MWLFVKLYLSDYMHKFSSQAAWIWTLLSHLQVLNLGKPLTLFKLQSHLKNGDKYGSTTKRLLSIVNDIMYVEHLTSIHIGYYYSY